MSVARTQIQTLVIRLHSGNKGNAHEIIRMFLYVLVVTSLVQFRATSIKGECYGNIST